MNWKTNIQLLDLEPGTKVECLCLTCGQAGYRTPDMLGDRQLYLDEAEAGLRCAHSHCGGEVMVALPQVDRGATFMGGLS